MAAVYPVQLSMARGEITPYAHSRADTDHYALGLAVARNWLVMRYGGLTRRPGTFFDNSTKTPAKKSTLRWFNFSQAQNYALEFGDLYVRFHTVNGRVETAPGVAYEVVAPWAEADLENIVVQTAGDVVYVACAGYEVHELRRVAETNWTLVVYDEEFGPYLDEGSEAKAFINVGGQGLATSRMTSNAAPAPATVTGTIGAGAYQAFDGNDGTDYYDGGISNGTLVYGFGGGNSKVVDAYWIKASSNPNPSAAPSTWRFEGHNGTNWVTLDTRTGETGWSVGQVRYYSFINTTAYLLYQIVWVGTGFTGGAESRFAEIGMHESGDTMPPFDIFFSSTAGINGGAGFSAADVGRSLRLLGVDGRWRDAVIASVVSGANVKIRLYGQALTDGATITRWQLGAFSSVSANAPNVVSMYESRLVLANTPSNPLDAWFSKSADFDNHGVSIPVVDDDAVAVRMSNGQLNEILWLVEAGDLMVGTAGGLRVIGRNDPGKAFSPSNVRQKGQTRVRASSLQPIVIERTVLFSEFHKRALYESAFNYEADGYVALELTMLAEHVFTSGIKAMAYQDTPTKVLWVVLQSGELAACTYDREQKVFGVSPADTDGFYESVVVLPGERYDVPMFIVRRGARRDIERMADPFRMGGRSTYNIPVYFDGCSIYQGAPTNNISNLLQLAGLTVGYWADGADRGNIDVSADGVATFPSGITYSNVVIGRRFNSRGETLRLAQAGNRDGGIMGRKARVIDGYLDMLESYGVMAGSKSAYERGELELMRSTEDAELRPVVPTLHTGFTKMHTDDSWQGNGVYVFETDKGYPATIRSIMTSVETEP